MQKCFLCSLWRMNCEWLKMSNMLYKFLAGQCYTFGPVEVKWSNKDITWEYDMEYSQCTQNIQFKYWKLIVQVWLC